MLGGIAISVIAKDELLLNVNCEALLLMEGDSGMLF